MLLFGNEFFCVISVCCVTGRNNIGWDIVDILLRLFIGCDSYFVTTKNCCYCNDKNDGEHEDSKMFLHNACPSVVL